MMHFPDLSYFTIFLKAPQTKRISIEQNMTGHDLKFAPK